MKKVLLFICLMFSVYGTNYLYNADGVRFELYQTNAGKYNWLFFPGGPGADSSYLHSLIDELTLPGNVWLIDLPGNGSNVQDGENYDHWMELFPKMIKQFDNAVLVGHSFGGMFPLLFPELEEHLKGFVILNSTPVLWMEDAVNYSKQFDLPDLSKDMDEFTHNPSLETFTAALDACIPYYFPPETMEKGRKLFAETTCQWKPAVWWQHKAVELNFSARWVPKNVPTLIVGGKYDCICPFCVFEKDVRFHRRNIQLYYINNAGHLPWIENPTAVRRAFSQFYSQLTNELEFWGP